MNTIKELIVGEKCSCTENDGCFICSSGLSLFQWIRHFWYYRKHKDFDIKCKSGKHTFIITDINCEDEIWASTINGHIISENKRQRCVQVHECQFCPSSEGAEWYKDGPYANIKLTELEARQEIADMRQREKE